MAGAGEERRHAGDEDPGVKYLRVAMADLEMRMDAKIDRISQDLRQMLAQIIPNEGTGRRPRRERDRGVANTLVRPEAHHHNDATRRDRRAPSEHTDSAGSDIEVADLHSRRRPLADSDFDDDVDDWIRDPHRYVTNTRRSHAREPPDFRIKVDIPCFDGHLHIEDFLDWIQTVENFFDYMNVPDSKQVKLVAYKLKGGASAWWEQLQSNRRREGKQTIRNWARMRTLLKSHFLPTDYEQILYQQYQRCRQRDRSVSVYTEEFYRLSARNNLNETERLQVARYIGGLRESI